MSRIGPAAFRPVKPQAVTRATYLSATHRYAAPARNSLRMTGDSKSSIARQGLIAM